MSIPLSKIFSTFSLAVMQYERADFSVGHEEELHWAIVAVHSSDNDIKGYASWQAIDRHYSDGRPNPIVWELHYSSDVQLNKDARCLGGVYIGQLKGQDVKKLNKLIHANVQPVSKFEGWNCRDWVLEVIKDILVPNGWADGGISTHQSLLPSLKIAAPKTVKARKENKLAAPCVVPQLPVAEGAL
ncbi:uncharacterized protein SCHCODRAFT_02671654 [Schizophyllum commune H4-8]|nr:uncharacterized protein SCHCODRAFT_02671654 [Schizophyllum commune H4-8]KAI5887669.1 hypothetical protein SCHCODRAFT_02671654 [Schizophyllum commune H4-8]